MSERKVLNKYYPPEFDPSKIPKLRVKKTGVFSIRVMAPFNMRCDTCGEYIYKGKKFNSRKENVDDEFYLGLRIFRFYIKCPRCVAEIAFKTDLANTDYALEAGATRLFEAEKLAHQMAEKERKEKEEDELNPMKMLENRTKASRNEIEQLDQLEELREMNARNARVDHENMIKKHLAYEEQLLKLQEEEEDNLVQAILRKGRGSNTIRRIDDEDDDDGGPSQKKRKEEADESFKKPSDILVDDLKQTPKEAPLGKPVDAKPKESWQRSVGSFSKKTSLAGLVKKKSPATSQKQEHSSSSAPSSSNATSSSSTSQTVSDVGKTSNPPVVVDGGQDPVAGSSSSQTSTSGSSGIVTGLSLVGDYSDSDESE